MMTNRRKELINGLFILILCGGAITMGIIEYTSLKKHRALTVGHIYDLTGFSKSPEVFVRYTYIVQGKEYHEMNSLPKTNSYDHLQPLYKLLLNKTFPVAYDTTNFSSAQILISSIDYKGFGVTRPDSLGSVFRAYDSIVKK